MRLVVFPSLILLLAFEATSAETQSSYPVISKTTQRVRDIDRRLILETELLRERQTLAEAQSASDKAPTAESRAALNRHTENVKALLRELDGTADKHVARIYRGRPSATRPSGNPQVRVERGTASFWDPYNRALDPTDSSTLQRKEMP